MASSNIPYLCGGILFDFLLEARKSRHNARDKYNSGSDGLSDPEVMKKFVYIVTGEDTGITGKTLKKATTQYKSCQISNSTYIPFKETSTVSAFDSAVKNKKPDLLNRMSEFIDRFINLNKAEWLVKALIEVIVNDAEIAQTDKFAVTIAQYANPSELKDVTRIELQPFLLSVLHYVILHRQDNEKGRATFEALFSRHSDKAGWEFNSNIGEAITQPIKVDYIHILGETDAEGEAETAEAEVCSEDKDSSKTQIINNNTIVNQYGENNIHIDHIETFKL